MSLDNDDPYVLVYLRRNPANGNSILVVLNMSAEPRTVKLDLATLGFKRSSAKNILSALDLGQESPPLAHLSIPPFGVFVGSVHEPIRAELSPPQSRKLRLR